MKILLTGACGTIARAILRAPDAEPHTFVRFDVTPDVESLPNGIRGSITDRETVFRAAEGCDAIIHTAAMHAAFRDKAQTHEFITTNVVGADHLYQAALKHGIKRLVMSSTLEVLCGGEWTASGPIVFDENTPPRPDWIYPASKLLAEELGHFYAKYHGLEVVQLRYAWVLAKAAEKIGTHLLSHGVAATDVADANLLAATRANLKDHVFLIAPDSPITQEDIETSFRDPWAVVEKYWPGSAEVLRSRSVELTDRDFWPVCRIDHAKRELGWQPKETFEKYLRSIGWTPSGRV